MSLEQVEHRAQELIRELEVVGCHRVEDFTDALRDDCNRHRGKKLPESLVAALKGSLDHFAAHIDALDQAFVRYHAETKTRG